MAIRAYVKRTSTVTMVSNYKSKEYKGKIPTVTS